MRAKKNIIRRPVITEKATWLKENENKYVFEIEKKCNKIEIKKAIEEIFKAKVIKVNTLIGPNGEKRAYVKFSMDTPAIDIATNMGLM